MNATIQERFYQRAIVKKGGRAGPEVRLYSSEVGNISFRVGCFGFVGTARESVHWIVPCIFICIVTLGIYTIVRSFSLCLQSCSS